ncbi:MAG TPA: Na+/H+ antiporter [Rhodopila sp.]|nr:Na+/H+ antiporter [Rhodopila sp.]
MTPVALFELILVLITVAVALELAARRLHLPPAAALILGGIVLAVFPGMPGVSLDPDLVLVLFLPPLLLASAYFTVWRDFRDNLTIILQLAVGAVVFTTVVVGVIAHWAVPSLPWGACFALGAIISPPDAVAAKAVLSRLRLPRRMVVLLEGESLVNDASGLVLFRFAVAATMTGTFSAGHALVTFGGLAVGGVAIGVVTGWLASHLIKRLRDPQLSTIASFLVAWVSYIAADALGVSGVLSTVACGLVIGSRQHSVLTAETRTQATAVWGVTGFVLESLVFILIGLSLRGVMERLGGDWHTLLALLPAMAAIVGAVIVSRFLWIFPAAYLPRIVSPRYRAHNPLVLGMPLVLSWAGMRGVVSLAVALSLPQDFPGRDFILVTTFAVILVTVLLQGSTLAPLIRLLHVSGIALPLRRSLTEAEAQRLVAIAQLAAVERAGFDETGKELHPRLLEQYRYRVRASTAFLESAGALIGAKHDHFSVVLEAIKAGRMELLRLHRSGELHDTILHRIEEQLDLEELAAQRLLGEAVP